MNWGQWASLAILGGLGPLDSSSNLDCPIFCIPKKKEKGRDRIFLAGARAFELRLKSLAPSGVTAFKMGEAEKNLQYSSHDFHCPPQLLHGSSIGNSYVILSMLSKGTSRCNNYIPLKQFSRDRFLI